MSTSPDQPETERRDPISSDTGVKTAPRGEHPVTGAVGLFLRVRPTKKGVLTRRWIVRVTIGGRRPKFGLGLYPTVGLAHARQLAQDALRDVAEGKEPGVRAKRRQRLAEAARTLTLAKAIEDSPVPRYKNPKSNEILERALRVSFASLHSRDVASISAADVAGVLGKLKPQTAIKAHTAIRRVFDYAITTLEPHRVLMFNPADPRRLRSVGWSPKPSGESESHAAVHWRVIPPVVDELGRTDDVDAACMLFIVATAARSKTARLTKWTNIVFDPKGEDSTWTPPFADLKDGKHHKRPFIVPLNSVALGVLERMRGRSSSRYVFAKSGGGPIAEGDITNLIRRLRRRHPDWRDPDSGEPFTVHGFRATFRTWAEDKRREDDALAELCLGHKVHGEVAARYIRTGLVEERRALLDAWSRYLRSESVKVITLRQG
jgi:integrase